LRSWTSRVFFKFWGRGGSGGVDEKGDLECVCESLWNIPAKPALTAVLPHEEDWILMASYCLYR